MPRGKDMMSTVVKVRDILAVDVPSALLAVIATKDEEVDNKISNFISPERAPIIFF